MNGVTKVSISHDGIGTDYLPQTIAMLNIGTVTPNNQNQQAGDRRWMDVGTYYNYDTDNMYVGLKDDGANSKDAVINWGDDITANPDADYENLKFIFTGYQLDSITTDPYNYNRVNGLEIARMNAHGNMGIGATFTSQITPKRRLDIFDDGLDHNPIGGGAANVYKGGPQLRLTQTLATNTTDGTWTDFQTTNTGDLYLHPSSSSVNRFVGINDASPSNTLEITSTPSVSPQPAGLRFTNLTNNVLPVANPDADKGVLSVDANGDVIFVTDESGSGGGGVAACPGGGVQNYITKWFPAGNQICASTIFESPTPPFNVGIGTISPANRLEVAGDINVSQFTNCIRAGGIKMIGLGPFSATTLVGRDAGGVDDNNSVSLPNGEDNTLVGYRAGFSFPNTASGVLLNLNTCLGSNAGIELGRTAVTDSADGNTFVGAYCAASCSTGRGNTAVGVHAGSSYGNGSGDFNSALGFEALGHNTSGNNNSALGLWSLRNADTGGNNTAIGANAGATIFSGNNNSFLGANADALSINLNFATAIGAGTFVSTSNTIAIGRNTDQIVLRGTAPNSPFSLTLFGNSFQSSGSPDWNVTSDLNLKKNISNFTDGLNVIRNVNPINFTYKSNFMHNDTSGNIIGVSGEEMALVAPYTVDTIMVQLDSTSAALTPVITFNRNGLFYALLNSVKELDSINTARTTQLNQLQTQLNDFTNQLSQLQSVVDSCCSRGHGHGHGHDRNLNPNDGESDSNIDVRLSNTKAIILNQNVPNPFAEQTTISYFIPDQVSKAQIFFYDNNGTVLKVVDINEKGKGELNVFAADLSSGIYTYTLIADGKVIETKKMVKQ